jgi:hypothetical protein
MLLTILFHAPEYFSRELISLGFLLESKTLGLVMALVGMVAVRLVQVSDSEDAKRTPIRAGTRDPNALHGAGAPVLTLAHCLVRAMIQYSTRQDEVDGDHLKKFKLQVELELAKATRSRDWQSDV